MATLNEKIRKIVALATGMQPGRVRPANQEMSVSGDSFATVLITSEASEGWDNINYYDTDDLKVMETATGQRICTASIQFFRADAFDNARKFKSRTQLSNATDLMDELGIGLISVSEIRDLTQVFSGSYEDRAQLDFVFYIVSNESIILETFGEFPLELHTSDKETPEGGTDITFNFEVREP